MVGQNIKTTSQYNVEQCKTTLNYDVRNKNIIQVTRPTKTKRNLNKSIQKGYVSGIHSESNY